jgi:hypothetical protein
MAKDRVFELIQKEEVLLFVGAGMSLYAGYPSGEKLCEILYENLSNDSKKEIDFVNNLPKLADDIFNLKGGNKNYLFEILKKEFQKAPVLTDAHQLLAKIPHFKTIITTNYDTLIESTNKAIEVIRKSKDYPLASFKKQLLFKIHSDLSDTDRIILTNSDYNNYFSNSNEQTIFWNAVKDKLASNHILFIGYSMDDPNLNVIINNIIAELGDSRKEMFFVAPSISKSKLSFLQRNGIEYIESTGEVLIREIYEDLKLNYFPNLSKGNGTVDTALNFANSNQINITVNKKEQNLVIGEISSMDESKNYEVEVKFELSNDEKTEKIVSSLKGKDFEDIHLDSDSLKGFNLFFKGFRFKTEEHIKSLIVKKLAIFDFDIHLIFDDGFEIDSYPFKLYGIEPYKNECHLKIEVEEFIIIIRIEFQAIENSTKYNVQIIPSNKIKSTISGLKFYQILSKIISNQKFKIYKENKIFYNYVPKIEFSEDALDAKLLFNYFQNLKKIERYFDVRFSNINLEMTYEKSVDKILAFIDKIKKTEQFTGHVFKIENKEEFENFIESGDQDRVLIMSESEKTIINLYDIQFDLGYLHRIIEDVFIENLEDLKSRKTSDILLKSKSNSISISFLDSPSLLIQ